MPGLRPPGGALHVRRRTAGAAPAGGGAGAGWGGRPGAARAAGVTVITGLPLSAAELSELAGDLKRRCGSGGTVRDGTIEIQGDHRDLLVAELAARGWPAKRAGG